MIGLILAGGLGTRLRPLTYFTPKPMIKVGDKPVLEHLVEHLQKFNINTIIVNTHYKPHKIMKHFGSSILYTYEPKLLGEEGTIEAVRKFTREPIVVMNGDTLTNINIDSMESLSGGQNISAYDGKTYTGCRIVYPNTKLDKFRLYYDINLKWIDMGTPEGLKKARKLYE